jgi:diguanylate cyclase
MFKRDTKETGPAPVETERGGLDSMMDLAATLLREYGRTALDMEDVTGDSIRKSCEQWANHLLAGGPQPGKEAAPASLAQRDVAGARAFFVEQRRDEVAFVSRSLAALRRGVWSFVQTLEGLLHQDHDVDIRVTAQLERLRELAQSGTPVEILRREVLGAVEEIGQLAQERHRQLRERVEGLSHRVTELDSQLETARIEGEIDALTRLYNRKAFDQRVVEVARMSRVSGRPTSLLLFDIDHFKQVNDTLGHLAGDVVLRQVADRLVRKFRTKSDFVARYGGEEFAILLWETSRSAEVVANRMLAALADPPIVYEQVSIPITGSFGIAQLRPEETELAWIERSDRALYAAKAQGRNQVVADHNAEPAAAQPASSPSR